MAALTRARKELGLLVAFDTLFGAIYEFAFYFRGAVLLVLATVTVREEDHIWTSTAGKLIWCLVLCPTLFRLLKEKR